MIVQMFGPIPGATYDNHILERSGLVEFLREHFGTMRYLLSPEHPSGKLIPKILRLIFFVIYEKYQFRFGDSFDVIAPLFCYPDDAEKFSFACLPFFSFFICTKANPKGTMKTNSRQAREQCIELLKAVIQPIGTIFLEDLRVIAEIPEEIQDGMMRVK